MKLEDYIASAPPQEFNNLLTLMELATREAKYIKLIHSYFSARPNFAQRQKLLELGNFKSEDFIELLQEINSAVPGTRVSIAAYLLDKLVAWSLVSGIGALIPNGIIRYQWNIELIRQYFSLGIVDNILLGPSHVARKYGPSIPAIIVEKGGDLFTGTGFLVSLKNELSQHSIVTAKHNVDPDDGIEFLKFHPDPKVIYTQMSQNGVRHSTLDIALMPVSVDGLVQPIHFFSNESILLRTITLGYPKISMTDGPYLLANSGELNAIVSDYKATARSLLISNIVSPGNSGGPVLTEAGLCVGMVVRQLISKHDEGFSTVNAAIPAKEMLQFLMNPLAL